MSDLLDYGVETLGGFLKENSGTRSAFKNIARIFDDILELALEQNKGMVGSLGKQYLMAFARRHELITSR